MSGDSKNIRSALESADDMFFFETLMTQCSVRSSPWMIFVNKVVPGERERGKCPALLENSRKKRRTKLCFSV